MEFNKHGSFYVRQTWPMKAVDVILSEENNNVFSPQNELLAIDELGIGRVMVRSLRYWIKAMKLAKESKDNKGNIQHHLTNVGKIIAEYDSYFQTYGTLWLLHYNLASNKDNATTWYWFFNEFNRQSFTREQFLNELQLYIFHNHEEKIAESSLIRDYNCLRQSYLPPKIDDISNLVEEGIMPFFSRTELLAEEGKFLVKQHSADMTLPVEILYYCILDQLEDHTDQLSIEQIYEGKKFAGRIFSLSYQGLEDKLEILENMNYISVYNRLGQHHIQIIQNDKDLVLREYYRKEQ